MSDMVNNPKHYQSKNGNFDVIDIVLEYDLNFLIANSVKYLLRAGKKNKETHIEDLEKAIFYINREIKRLKND